MAIVYVLNKRGEPLMPTTRCGHVAYLLKQKLAVVVSTNPFTIRLKYATPDGKQHLFLGIDPGRDNIGVAVITAGGECVFAADAVTNNKDVPKRMAKRKMHRMASRRGERLRRQRRAKKNGTCFTERQRILPGCKEPIILKLIKNTEARFNNRTRPAGWFTPTANHLRESTLNLVSKIQRVLPVTCVVLELNKFAFMAMDNPNIRRWQYQKGPLYGKGSVKEAVSAQQNGHCLFCDEAIAHYHHIIRRGIGSNTLQNIAGACEKHHDLVHKDNEWAAKMVSTKEGLNKKYGALSVLNQIIPSLVEELARRFPGTCFLTNGRNTAAFRDANGIGKSHHTDAYCIACSLFVTATPNSSKQSYSLRQFRRHDRAVTSMLRERYYHIGKTLVAKNRHKRMGQTSDSLEEFRLTHPDDVGKLKVDAGGARYTDPKRILPGAIFMVDGKRMVLQGREGKTEKGESKRYEFVGYGKFNPKHCSFIQSGGGWQYV